MNKIASTGPHDYFSASGKSSFDLYLFNYICFLTKSQ